MKKAGLSIVILISTLILSTTVLAANKVIVAPFNKEKLTCSGTLDGTRWCGNGDGTVTDMTTGLVWLQNANCFGIKKWIELSGIYNDAHKAAGLLRSSDCGLSDGSVAGEWRLPTFDELKGLTSGTESVRFSNPRLFNNLLKTNYWSSTTQSTSAVHAVAVSTANGGTLNHPKSSSLYVLPVRDR